MLKILAKLSLLFLVSGCVSLHFKNAIRLPAVDYRIDQSTLRTAGYYYCEKTKLDYCRSVPAASGMSIDPDSEYEEKYISAFILSADGYCYYTGGLVTSGIDKSSHNYCNELYTHNTYRHALKNFEQRISRPLLSNDGRQDRGVFAISGDTILFQVYQSGSAQLPLIEYEGVIINDTTFHLHSGESYKGQKSPLDDTYHFKSFGSKPDSTSYIRDHRDRFQN